MQTECGETGQGMWGLEDRSRTWSFYSSCDEQPLEGFKRGTCSDLRSVKATCVVALRIDSYENVCRMDGESGENRRQSGHVMWV